MRKQIQTIRISLRSFLWSYLPWIGCLIRALKGTSSNTFAGGTDHNPSKVFSVLQRYSQLLGERDCPVAGKVCLELGTGNSPDVAFLMLLSGASRSIMVDTAPFMKVAFQNGEEYHKLITYLKSMAVDKIKFPKLPENLNTVDYDKISARLEYLNYDGLHLPLPDASVDIIYSKSVLEHVRQPMSLFAELRRISKTEAIHLHIADLRDHFHVHDDYTVGGDWLEFLQYDEETWERKCINTDAWCNRLRLQSWRSIVQSTGFEILREHIVRFPLPAPSVPSINLNPAITRQKNLDAGWWWVLLQANQVSLGEFKVLALQ